MFERSLDLTVDKEEAIRAAKAHGSGDSDLFSTALSFLGQTKVSTYDRFDGPSVLTMFLAIAKAF